MIMAIDPGTILSWSFPQVEHKYEAPDAILYALGIGSGQDPLDQAHLNLGMSRLAILHWQSQRSS